MDAFYASVEQRDNPATGVNQSLLVDCHKDVVELWQPPVMKRGNSAFVGDAFKKSARALPDVNFIRPRFEVYKAVSTQIRAIFQRYTDLIEPLSLDEAFLDVTQDKQEIGSAIDIAKAIKQAIRDELQLTASAGVSINKFIAKIASDMNKPDGLTFIGPSKIQSFVDALGVEKFFGVGKING